MKIRVKKNGARIAALGLVVAMLLAGPGVSGAQTVVRGACKTEGVVFATSNSVATLSGFMIYADIPDMSVSVFVQGTQPACLMVSFSATTYSPYPFRVRPMMDGVVIGVPTGPSFSGVWFGEVEDSRTFNFFFTNVQPGAHTITMQLGTILPMALVEVRERTLAVHVPNFVQFRGF